MDPGEVIDVWNERYGSESVWHKSLEFLREAPLPLHTRPIPYWPAQHQTYPLDEAAANFSLRDLSKATIPASPVPMCTSQ